MKKILLVLTVPLLLVNCKKPDVSEALRTPVTPTPYVAGEPYLKYKIHSITGYDVLHEYFGDAGIPGQDGVVAVKLLKGSSNPGLYAIRAVSGANNSITFDMITDSLVPGKYFSNYPTTFERSDGNIYATFEHTNGLEINVTRNSQGSIDGNFSGFLYWWYKEDHYDSMMVSEGEFRNVRIIY